MNDFFLLYNFKHLSKSPFLKEASINNVFSAILLYSPKCLIFPRRKVPGKGPSRRGGRKSERGGQRYIHSSNEIET